MPARTCSTCGAIFQPAHPSHRKCPAHVPRGRAARSPTTRAQDGEYRRERQRILAGSPVCHYCPAPATTVDHVIPVSKGGGHRGNLVPACARCNGSKGDRAAPRSAQPSRPAAARASTAPRRSRLV